MGFDWCAFVGCGPSNSDVTLHLPSLKFRFMYSSAPPLTAQPQSFSLLFLKSRINIPSPSMVVSGSSLCHRVALILVYCPIKPTKTLAANATYLVSGTMSTKTRPQLSLVYTTLRSSPQLTTTH